MAKSPYVERLDEVQILLWAELKALGFRRRGRVFNRSAEEGVVQVITLQSGQYEVNPIHPLPEGLAEMRQNLYGRFTVNLGVHVWDVWEATFPGGSRPTFINDGYCQVRSRLGQLADGIDRWWSLGSGLINRASSSMLLR